ncbi:7,8-didemethyl-8-hydroxy-5-deazariboflavin synthase subunit CofG [filamentous cyanobacterium LEGE 11480]|uniref:7,8-didemethyl-8-hydroxy-5-deazariboflavin synthase n=1 Tax=Romeriopsis navalis LEGE 11480 TaxID=2777977 RepID=A0A928VSI2_9CYAN|nr:7,8-didemethyl-8-hydroxy-5-deazariboflavin synthase subunit CofG [Romeriopsis navalis]MBE9032948.1 7,8-didemethyl-8-hydroxy-5-deazariboflavin synthase subunit CofG [Romeriopsis navalis LEGE 11480]
MHSRTVRSHTVTYSPAYTIVPTYECFNHCSYCNFRTDPGQSPWLRLADARSLLQQLRNAPEPVIEILVLSGEVHPKSARRQAWFEHIYQLCELALEQGFLPHTNVGPLSYEEMRQLKQVNVSMGLMLEQMAPELHQTVHQQAPSKSPELRLEQLRWAGELQIPFTTGLLLGIGETSDDWRKSLQTIADQQAKFGHIQEVILQPYSPGQQEDWFGSAFDLQQLPAVVALARAILPDTIVIQIPPNLIDQPALLVACLEAGARDLGGIGPHDEVNPDYPHPTIERLAAQLHPQGWQLKPRLPVYSQYQSWLPSQLQQQIKLIVKNSFQVL